MPALDLHGLANGLTVGDLGFLQGDVYAELGLQLGDGHVQVLLAQAGEDHLVGLGVGGEAQGGVFLRQPQHALGHLVLLALLGGDDGHGQGGSGILHPLQGDFPQRRAQGVAGVGSGQLGDGPDVPGADVLHVHLLFAHHHHGLAHPLGIAGAHVDELGLGGDLAGDHLQVRELADEGVGHGFKHDGSRGPVLVDRELHRVAVHVHAQLPGLVLGRGGQPAQAVQELLHAPHEHGVAAEHRGDGAGLDALAHAQDHLFGGEGLAGEVFLKQLVVGFGDGLVNGGAQAFQPVAHVGHGHSHGLAAGVVVGLVLQQVDVDVGLAVLDVGHHHRAHRGAELGLQVLEHPVEPGALVAQAVDEEDFGQVPLLGGGHGLLRAHGHPVLAGDDHQHRVRGPHGFHHAALKVEKAGGVQQVDLLIFPLQGRHGGGDGGLAADLLGVVVADGVAVAHFAPPVGGAGKIEHGLRQGGLSRPAVPGYRQVDDMVRLILVHCRLLPPG